MPKIPKIIPKMRYTRFQQMAAVCLLASLYLFAGSRAATAAAGPAGPADTLYLGIEELFRLGVEHSLRLRASGIEEQIGAERSRAARQERLPELNVGLKGGYVGQPVVFEHGLEDATYPDAPEWSQNYVIELLQPIYDGGRIRLGIRRAEIEQRMAELSTLADRSAVKLELLRQYMDLFTLYKQCEVLDRNIEESERRLKDIHEMRREGLITNNDVLRSEISLTDDRLALREATDRVRLASQQLDIWIGCDERTILRPDTSDLAPAQRLESYEAYVDAAYDDEPTMRLLRAQTELAHNAERQARSAYLPSVSLYAGNTLARPIARTLDDLYNNNWNIGLSISYPLSALYRNRHKVGEQRLNVLRSENAEQQQMQRLRMRIRSAYLRHEQALERVRTLELSVLQAEENYRIMRNRYMEQLAILTDLLDADRLRLESQLKLTTARTEVVYTYYELLDACGRL